MNEHAQALGRLAKGVPKNFSQEDLKRRSDRMKAYNESVRQAKKDRENASI